MTDLNQAKLDYLNAPATRAELLEVVVLLSDTLQKTLEVSFAEGAERFEALGELNKVFGATVRLRGKLSNAGVEQSIAELMQ